MPNLGEVRDTRAQNFNNEVETKESVNLIHVFHLYIYIYICVCVHAHTATVLEFFSMIVVKKIKL